MERNFIEFLEGDCYSWQEDVTPGEAEWFRFQEAIKEHQQLAMEQTNRYSNEWM